MEEGSMADEKQERPGAGMRKMSETGDDPTRKASGSPSRPLLREAESGADGGALAASPGRRRERYLIGIRTAPDGQPLGYPLSMDDVVAYLGRQQNVEVVKRIKLAGTQPFTADGRSANEIAVAKIDEGKAQWLRSVAPPHLIIERDSLLECADYLSLPVRAQPLGTLLPLRSVATEIVVRVVGERDQPLARAMVVLDGVGLPVQALTDDSGTARIAFFGGSSEAIHALFVRAASNYWDRLIREPRLSAGTITVRLRPLSEVYPNFPSERLLGWGQRLMGLDPTSGRFSGSGVKIGLIDSGCDNSHPLLRHVTRGKDFTGGAADTAWTQDAVSHGTHCAGILNASNSGNGGQGIVGCAPEAELHVFKVIPGGRVSDLLAALDECIERELDLVNISVVGVEFSELVTQKLQEARHKGIACIVAAGNTGGPVAFPAMVPGAIAVAAVGKLKEFPADSSHALSVIPQLIGSEGIFAAAFSAAGPQIALSAPGVAVVSTVPGGGYAAADGTSSAAAHVTGFGALMLAHHPLFQEEAYRARSGQRVHALFELMRASAVPRFADPLRAGAGVPDLPRVPGGPGFAMGLSLAEGAQRMGLPPRWPLAAPAWPAAWITPIGGAAAGFY
jgi:subtilisin